MRSSMPSLTDSADSAFEQQHFAWQCCCEFFDGDSTSVNIALECITRYAGDDARAAVRLVPADGRNEMLTSGELADGQRVLRIGCEPMMSASQNMSRSCGNPRRSCARVWPVQ